MNKHPYELIDGMTGAIVCIYKALHVACSHGEAKNKATGDRRFYVRCIKDGRIIRLAA